MTATVEPAMLDAAQRQQARPPVTPKKVASVKIWAAVGALILAFEAYVLIKWVTGPNFKNVPPGPTPVPLGFKIAGTAITIGGAVATLWFFWNWVVKPWRQARTVTAEGLMLVWFATFAWFFDPFANCFHAFFTYNSWLPNCGPGTDQACPSPALPMPTRHSGHFDPHGNFIVRDGSPAPADANQVTEFAK